MHWFDWINQNVLTKEEAEMLASFMQMILAFATVTALIYVSRQLKEARKTTAALSVSASALSESAVAQREHTETIATQARATLLLSLEERWNSSAMRDARAAVADLRSQAAERVSQIHPNADNKTFQEEMEAYSTSLMNELRADERRQVLQGEATTSSDSHRYNNLTRACGFFEVVGLMVKKRYIEFEDIDALFRGPIAMVGTVFQGHIKYRQDTEKNLPPGLYENLLFLVQKTVTTTTPRRSSSGT